MMSQDLTDESENSDFDTMSTSNKILILAAGGLLCLVLFMFAMHMYVRCLWRRREHYIDEIEETEAIIERRRRRRSRRNRRHAERFEDDEEDYEIHFHRGLAKSVLEQIPTFVFKLEETVSANMQCAVCLEDFEEGDKGRKLPKCSHCFHVDCIDMWLNSHSSCPLCRCEAASATIQALPACPRDSAYRYRVPETFGPLVASGSTVVPFTDADIDARGRGSLDSLPMAVRASVANALRAQNIPYSESEMDEDYTYAPFAHDYPVAIQIDMEPSTTSNVTENNTSDEQPPPEVVIMRRPGMSPGTTGSHQHHRQGSSNTVFIVDYRPTVNTIYSTQVLPPPLPFQDETAPTRAGHRRRRSYLSVEIISDCHSSSSDLDSDEASSSSHESRP